MTNFIHTDTDEATNFHRNRPHIIPLPNTPEAGSPEWHRARGLPVISDLFRDYAAIRRPQGLHKAPPTYDPTEKASPLRMIE